MIHYWYYESKRVACHKDIVKGDSLSTSYEAVDCEPCRRSLGWPDPADFPNLSTHPNHVTNRRGITVTDDPETRKRNAKEFGMERPEILDD